MFSKKRVIAVLLTLCLLISGMEAYMSVSAATSVNIVFNPMDTVARQDMEPAGNAAIKDLSTHTADYLEGSGSVKYGYKADFNDVYFYGRVPAAYDTTGISIAGATHMIFDLYVSDTTKWTITNNSSFTLRSLKSAQSTGQWDNSCGQIDSANIYSVFSGLRNGWNHVVLPINTSVATETVIWGFRLVIGGGAPKAGFYVLMDDIRFVNQTYLDSAQYATRNLDKMVTRVKAIMAAVPSITNAPEQRRMRMAANITYHSLDATRKNQATGGVVPYDGLDWTDNGVPSEYLGTRKTVNKGDYAFSLAVLSDLHYAVRNNAAWQDVYLNAMNWIVNNSQKENTLMAIQLGDMTSNVDYNDGRNETCEWDSVRSGFDILRKAKIPFATAVGNHDAVYGYTNYHNYFPYAEQKASPYFGGAMQEGRTENLYYTFEVSGVKYMILTLDLYPDANQLAWADSVVKAHPYHNVIIATHSYLKSKNTYEIVHTTETEDPSYLGENLWNKVIKNNPNVILTFSAHNEYPYRKAGLGLLKGTNDYGKTVHQFLVGDPQFYEMTTGGLGSVIMVRFSHDGKKIALEYVSTRYDKQLTGFTNESPLHTTNYYEISVEPETEPVVFDSWSEGIQPVCHVGLSTANDTDANWTNYQYMAQEFCPAQKTISGVKIPLNLTAGKATMHVEIRSSLNGQAIASNDVPFTSKGNGMFWYDFPLKEELAVTPKQPYYFVYYLTARDASTVCIVYATPHNEAVRFPAATWYMPSGGNVVFNINKTMIAGFEIMYDPLIKYGDVDQNGKVESSDALKALQCAVELVSLAGDAFTAADVDGSKAINTFDALLILQKSVNKITSFPIQK